jgi:hypothetical protein
MHGNQPKIPKQPSREFQDLRYFRRICLHDIRTAAKLLGVREGIINAIFDRVNMMVGHALREGQIIELLCARSLERFLSTELGKDIAEKIMTDLQHTEETRSRL